MPMREELLKVKLSPSDGQFWGWFTEGWPLAEAIGLLVALQVDGKNGTRIRRFGLITGIEDQLWNIDNDEEPDEQVVRTTIYFENAPPLSIKWADTAVAVAEIALPEQKEETP